MFEYMNTRVMCMRALSILEHCVYSGGVCDVWVERARN